MGLMNTSINKTWNYGWVIVGTLLLVDSLVTGVTFTLGLMLPSISRDLGLSLPQIGWLGAINWGISAILTIPLAFQFSRYSPKKLVVFACACQALFLFLQGLAPNYGLLLLCRIAFMAGGLVRFVAYPMLMQQWFPREKITLVNTVAIVCSGIGGGTVVFFMGDLLSMLNGWRNIFYLFGAGCAVLLFAWMILGKEKPLPGSDADVQAPIGIKNVLKHRTLWLLGIGVAGDLLCFSAMETLWPKYATSLGFISLNEASYCEGLSYYGFTIGSLLGGLISMKLGRRKPVLWISGLLLPFMTVGILVSRSFPVLAWLWAMWGICELYFPIVATIPYELPGIKPREVAIASAFIVSVYTAGAGLGPLVGGYLASVLGSLERALFIICVFPILLFITGLMVKETGPGARLKSRNA